MATTERKDAPAGQVESTSTGESLVDLWFVLAMIIAAVHLHAGAQALRRATSGQGSVLLSVLLLAAAVGIGGLLLAHEGELLPLRTVYGCGIGLAGLLLYAYADVTVLGVVAPAFGIDAATGSGPLLPTLLGQLQQNALALTSKLAELGMIGVLGGLYVNSKDGHPLGGRAEAAGTASHAARAPRTERTAPPSSQGPRDPSGTAQHGTPRGRAASAESTSHARREADSPSPGSARAAAAPAGATVDRSAAGAAGAAVNRSGAGTPGAVGTPSATTGTENATRNRRETEESLLERFGLPDSWGLLTMRLSLAMVFTVFGFKKMWPASPAEPVVEHTVFFFPHAEFFWLLGFWETLVGVALLWRRTLRFAAWLFFFQMAGTLLGLIFFIEGTWHIFPIYPTDIGTYIIKNFIFLGAAMVLVIGYTGSQVREPPVDRLNNETMKTIARKFHWLLSTWVPRHSLTFLRSIIVVLLVLFGLKTMAGKGNALVNVQIALNQLLGLGLSVGAVYFLLGGLKVSSGLLLISNKQEYMTYSVIIMGAYIFIGLLPMIVTPERAFFRGWLIAPAFATLWFLKDFVTLGGIWTIRDLDHSWEPTRAIDATRDGIEVLLTWCGIDTTSTADSSTRRQ